MSRCLLHIEFPSVDYLQRSIITGRHQLVQTHRIFFNVEIKLRNTCRQIEKAAGVFCAHRYAWQVHCLTNLFMAKLVKSSLEKEAAVWAL